MTTTVFGRHCTITFDGGKEIYLKIKPEKLGRLISLEAAAEISKQLDIILQVREANIKETPLHYKPGNNEFNRRTI